MELGKKRGSSSFCAELAVIKKFVCGILNFNLSVLGRSDVFLM